MNNSLILLALLAKSKRIFLANIIIKYKAINSLNVLWFLIIKKKSLVYLASSADNILGVGLILRARFRFDLLRTLGFVVAKLRCKLYLPEIKKEIICQVHILYFLSFLLTGTLPILFHLDLISFLLTSFVSLLNFFPHFH